jgi:hypothetical protein
MLRQGGVNIGDLYIVAIDTDRVNTCYNAYGMAQRLRPMLVFILSDDCLITEMNI